MFAILRRFLAVTVALAVVSAAWLTVMSGQPAYAKGPAKSSGEGKSDSGNSGSGSRSENRSDNRSESRPENRSDSGRSGSSGASNSSGSSSSSSRQSSGSSIGSRTESSRSASTSRVVRPDSYTLRTPGSTAETRRVQPSYRKEYADIGDVFKSRQEKRDSPPTSGSWSTSDGRSGRTGSWGTGGGWYGGTYGTRYGVSYYDRDYRMWHGYAFRYRHYCYDYRPTSCYPSLYCFYYDYYPPYVLYDRVIVIARLPSSRVYVEVPLFTYKRGSDYYLSNPADKGLWAAIRDVQQAWERSDPEFIMDHVERRSAIDVYMDGQYTYSLEEYDYYDMTRDAMSVIKTRSFDFDRVTRVDSDRYVARGTHVYTDRYGLHKTVYVTYTFQRYRTEWYIVAVGSSTRPI